MTYEPPSPDELREVRRLLPIVAAVLFVAALAFPMWRIAVRAVQYPDTVLHLEVYAYPRIAGDYREMANLNSYIGYYYPDPVYLQPNYEPHPYAVDVPEWSVGWAAFLAVAAGGAFVAVAPDARRLKRGLTYQLVGTVTVFAVMLADIQYRLWQTGHHLDPDAPVMGVDGFTPPLWGRYEVANITSQSRLGLGAWLSIAAVGLLVVAFRYRDTDTTVGEALADGRDRLGGIGGRIGGIGDRIGGDGTGSTDGRLGSDGSTDDAGDREEPSDPPTVGGGD